MDEEELAPMAMENPNNEYHPGDKIAIVGPSVTGSEEKIGKVDVVHSIGRDYVYTANCGDGGSIFPFSSVRHAPAAKVAAEQEQLVTGTGAYQLTRALLIARRFLRKSNEAPLPLDPESVAARDEAIELIDTVILQHPIEFGRQ